MKRASLNHVYKLIWNEQLSAFVAVSELAGARGKSARLRHALVSASLLSFSAVLHAGGVVVAPGSGSTDVYNAPNGVPVVDINKANTAGLSHNKFTDYNVNANGLILNNANSSQITRQSQLAGQILSNTNLSSEARVILNEVVAPNRSTLAGYTEVVGRQADVIVANPYGITCNGCGFINTDRVTLTTGQPNINGSGQLSGFTVNQGDILFDGSGLDATAQSYFNIVSRSATINAQINAKDLSITSGANEWDYASGSASSIDAVEVAPSYAVDSTALGGMYANRIHIKATDAGVGVRMRGDMAATASSFTMDVAGNIVMTNTVSAETSLTINSDSAELQAIALNDANISARSDITLTADNGTIELEGGSLYAEQNLTISAAKLNDSKTNTVADDNNVRFAQHTLTHSLSGTMTSGGTVWTSAGDINSTAGSYVFAADSSTIQASDSVSLTATSGDISLDDTVVTATNINLTSQTGNISTSNGASQGIQSDGGTLSLNAAGTVTNNGKIIADNGQISITAGALDNQGTVRADTGIQATLGSLTNGRSGNFNAFIYAGTQAANSSLLSSSGAVNNYGHIHSDGTLTVSGNSLFNSTTGALSSNNVLNLTANNADISNYGAIFANNALALNASNGAVINRPATGEIYSYGTLNINAGSFYNYHIINSSGVSNINTSSVFWNGVSTDLSNYKALNLCQVVGALTDCRWSANRDPDQPETFYIRKASDERNQFRVTTTFYRVQEYFTIDTSFFKPQLISGSNLTINYGAGSFTNNAGLISTAGNLHVTGSGTFTNQELFIEDLEYTGKRLFEQYPGGTNYWYPVNYAQWSNPPGSRVQAYLGDGTPYTIPDFDGSNRRNWVFNNVWTEAASDADAEQNSVKVRTGSFGVIQRVNAGIYVGGTLSGRVGPANNLGAPSAASPSNVTAPNTGTFTAPLPTNPNGVFVVSQNPQSGYLVETNPRFVNGNALGSDFLLDRLGLDVDQIGLRLGDAAYENFLIRQQLINETGNNIVNGYSSEIAMIGDMYESAATQQSQLGLVFGEALTGEQVANLDSDIVWMVETEINGQKALKPVVYLSQTTKDAVLNGATITAQNIDLEVESLDNIGGSINADESLKLTSEGDINNRSGNISGTDVELTSTQGSINNETLAVTRGDNMNASTEIGKTAGITASGDLSLNAARDITITGAEVKAGGDASLSAGNDITVDTIVDKTTRSSSTFYSTGGFAKGSNTLITTTTTTETNIGSQVSSGGDLNLSSGNNTTIAGSQANVGGDLNVNAGGNFNVLARQDKEITQTEITKSGMGVGGGLYGKQKTTIDTFKGTNVGSDIQVGGNLSVDAGNNMVQQGSDMTVAGSGDINTGNDVLILDGLDEEWSRSVTVTSTMFSFDKAGSSNSGSQTSSDSDGGVKTANAGASGNAGATGGAEFNVAKTTVDVIEQGKKTSVASNLSFGEGVSVNAGGDVVLQGSNLNAGDDVTLNAENVEVLAGRNESFVSRTTTTSKAGVFLDGDVSAMGNAMAQATGMSANAKAGSEGKGEANGVATFGNREEVSQQTTQTLTHTKSNLKAGGNLTINAEKDAVFQGADVEAGNNIDIDATNIINIAAEDKTVTTSSYSQTTTGTYVDGNLGLGAGLGALASPTSGGAKAEATAQGSSSAGLRRATNSTYQEQGSTTNQVNTFKAGGNINRNADETLLDQGTQLEAGNNIVQSANKIIEQAVTDKEWSISTSESTDARVGAYVGGEGKVGSGAQKSTIGKSAGNDGERDASAGARAQLKMAETSEFSSSEKAVTSSYKAGGSITSTSQEETVLIGTQMEAGENITLNAKSLDYQAARDTKTDTKGSVQLEAEGKAAMIGGVGGILSGKYADGDESKFESNAVVGGLKSGGNLTINTTDDATFEGVQMEAGQNVTIGSEKGNVNFNSAKDIKTENKDARSIEVELAASKKDGASGKFKGSIETGEKLDVTNTGTSIKSGNNISITSGNDVNFEGSQIEAGNNIDVTAENNINLLEARDISQENSRSVSVEASASKTDQEGTVNLGLTDIDQQQGQVTQIKSGGNTSLNADTIVNQETKLDEDASLNGKVINIAKTDVDKGYVVEVDAGAEKHKDGGDNDSSTQSANTDDSNKGTSQTQDDTATNTQVTVNNPAVTDNQRSISLPDNRDTSQSLELTSDNGQPAPDWVKVDATTGEINATPPTDFTGKLDVVVKIPLNDGTFMEKTISIEQ
ncbi:two-partner secretion domain-containing protein [Methylophaga thiooxydans]|uniref:Hemagglutination activity domain protein n=1 Tax=Methylophaga thiooxydans DMS010 TaxID=637616 RepID=C0N7I2_9GAMM|nr:hemagglutinin repeat-containing protein [Methylophaga thiooxydans]EEF79224.1 hemagglutination activity domain protein [Methylophaga thiooxydans DMS010]